MPVLLTEKSKTIERTYLEEQDLVIEYPSGYEFRPTKPDDYLGFIVMYKAPITFVPITKVTNNNIDYARDLEDRVFDFVKDQDSVLYLDNNGDLAYRRASRWGMNNSDFDSGFYWFGVPFFSKSKHRNLWELIQDKGSKLGYRKSKWCV